MSGPRLVLHAGHPKTGSSALQSAFALSTEALARAGIHYPRPVRNDAARAGRITSGNFNPARVVELHDRARTRHPEAGTVLFSNEACFRLYLADPAPLRQLGEHGVATEVILYVRDPLGLAVSVYAQSLKRGGGVTEFEDFLSGFRFMAQVERFLALMREAEVTLKVRNYARCSDRLLPVTEELLGVTEGTLMPPPVARVNRSLTRAEMDLMRRLNATLPKEHTARVADALCHELPLLQAETPRLSRPAYDAFAARMAPILARLNGMLPDSEHLRMDPYDTRFEAPAEPAVLSAAQQEVVDRALADAVSPAARAEAVAKTVGASPVLAPLRGLARRILRR
jgi:hypothetical protein